jgi:hypothetical protein
VTMSAATASRFTMVNRRGVKERKSLLLLLLLLLLLFVALQRQPTY